MEFEPPCADKPRKIHLCQGQIRFSPLGRRPNNALGKDSVIDTSPWSSLGTALLNSARSYCPLVPGGHRGDAGGENKHRDRSDPDHGAQLRERKNNLDCLWKGLIDLIMVLKISDDLRMLSLLIVHLGPGLRNK